MTRRAAGSSLAALLWLVACSGEPTPSEAPKPEASASVPAAPALRPGTMQLALLDGRVTLATREVPQAEILRELASRGAFELVAQEPLAERLTIRMTEAPLVEAVSLIVGARPYQMEFDFDDVRGGHRLARLRVGRAPPAVAAAAAPGTAPASASVPAAAARDRTRAPSAAAFELQRDVESRFREPALEDPELRRQRIARLEAEDEGDVDSLIRYAEEDPDPTVRKAAVERLADVEGSGRVVAALVARLSDSEREVVIAAIDSLEWQDDARALIALEQMLDDGRIYQDAELRERVVDAIDWIQE